MSENDRGNTYHVGRWRWLSVVSLFISAFLVRGTLASLGIIFVALIDYFKEGAGMTSWVVTISPALTLIVGPLATALAKRYGFRHVVMTGGIFSFLTLLISSFATSIWYLVVTIGILNGLAVGLVYSPTLAYTGVLFKKGLSLANGIGNSGIGIGAIILPIVFQTCIEHYGWRGTFMVYAAITANFCVCAAMMRPFTAQSQKTDYDSLSMKMDEMVSPSIVPQEGNEKELSNCEPTCENKSQSESSYNKSCCQSVNRFFDCYGIFCNFHFSFFSLCFFLQTGALAISLVHLAPLLLETGLSLEKVAIVLSVFGVGITAGGPFFGFIASHFKVNIEIYVGCGYFVYGVVLFLICTLTADFATAIVMVIMLGFVRGWFAAQNPVVAKAILHNDAFINGLGFLLAYGGLAQLIGVPISGYVKDYTGSYKPSFFISAVIHVSCGIAVVLSGMCALCKKRRQP